MKTFDFGTVSGLKVVKTNVRPSSDDKPMLKLSETPGRFILNALATEAMALSPGDEISFIEVESDELSGKFFICEGIEGNTSKLYSPTQRTGEGVTLNFNQSSVYSRLVQREADAKELGAVALERMGIYTSRPSKDEKKRNHSSLVTGEFEVVTGPTITVGEGDAEKEVQLYGLIDPVFETKSVEEVANADADSPEE